MGRGAPRSLSSEIQQRTLGTSGGLRHNAIGGVEEETASEDEESGTCGLGCCLPASNDATPGVCPFAANLKLPTDWPQKGFLPQNRTHEVRGLRLHLGCGKGTKASRIKHAVCSRRPRVCVAIT